MKEKRRELDFWLLAGMIGLWVWWLFLREVKFHIIKSYFWLFWHNKFPIGWIGALILLAAFCFWKRIRWAGITLLVVTIVFGYWAYGPDLPQRPPLKKPIILWRQLPHNIPVMLFITYERSEQSPPLPFCYFRLRLIRQQIYLNAQEWRAIREQSKRTLIALAQEAGEDLQTFSKCLSIAFDFWRRNNPQEAAPPLPLCAEKRYEYVTRQLCWIFTFFKPRRINDKTTEFLVLKGLTTNIDWVAVRLRFPKKAWLTYLAIDSTEIFRGLLSNLLVIAGYVSILVGLRYVMKKWF